MDYFNYRDTVLWAEDVSVASIAKEHGTPCFVYSRATFERHWHAFDNALGEQPHLICYAVKANSNIAILNILARLGSGFDVVSQGELERVLIAGGKPEHIVFSGVGKTIPEMKRALSLGIACFNVESSAELMTLNEVAKDMGVRAPVSLRINPNVDAQTHPYIATGLRENKFGIVTDIAKDLYLQHKTFSHLDFIGIDCHIGSQILVLDPFLEALDHLLALYDELREAGLPLKHLDLGGGLGVCYSDENPPHPSEQAKAVKERLAGRDVKIILEPGRAIAANAGILLTDVLYLKHNEQRSFAIVDAAMNDLLRPALYQAWQAIIPVEQRTDIPEDTYDIVGPVCETGDFLGKARTLAIEPGDTLAVRTAGAYGFCMSSQYNTRPRAAEILVDGSKTHVIRDREQLSDLYAHEHLLPE